MSISQKQPVTISEFMKVIDEIEKDEDLFEDIDWEHPPRDSGAVRFSF